MKNATCEQQSEKDRQTDRDRQEGPTDRQKESEITEGDRSQT